MKLLIEGLRQGRECFGEEERVGIGRRIILRDGEKMEVGK